MLSETVNRRAWPAKRINWLQLLLPLQARAAEDDDRGAAALLAKAAAARAEDAFKSAAAAEVFGSLAGGGMGLDARISSRRHYHER